MGSSGPVRATRWTRGSIRGLTRDVSIVNNGPKQSQWVGHPLGPSCRITEGRFQVIWSSFGGPHSSHNGSPEGSQKRFQGVPQESLSQVGSNPLLGNQWRPVWSPSWDLFRSRLRLPDCPEGLLEGFDFIGRSPPPGRSLGRLRSEICIENGKS